MILSAIFFILNGYTTSGFSLFLPVSESGVSEQRGNLA